MMDYVYITPKILTATFIFTLIQMSSVKDTMLKIGLFSMLYYLAGMYALGYDMNWKEIVSATVVCSVLIRYNLKPAVNIALFAGIMSLVRPLCYVS